MDRIADTLYLEECTLRSWIPKSFAEYTVVPEQAVVVIRPDVPLTSACLVGCGVMTGVGAVVNTARVEPGDQVAVFGCGGVVRKFKVK